MKATRGYLVVALININNIFAANVEIRNVGTGMEDTI